MIPLKHDTLSFAFPKISKQLRSLVDRHVQSVLSSYVLPANREELVDELGSMRPFWNLDRTAQGNLLTKARLVTDAEIEASLRKAALVAAGSNTDSPPQLTVKFQHPPRPPDTCSPRDWRSFRFVPRPIFPARYRPHGSNKPHF